jgi:hypothetical protein
VVVQAYKEPHHACTTWAGGRGRTGGNKDGMPLLLSSLLSNNKDEDDAAKEVCSLLSRTEIPSLVKRLIAPSPRLMVKWTQDSLKDA